MFNNMNSGYSGYSMSNRAVEAYENGEKPLSKWTKEELLNEIEEYFNVNPDMQSPNYDLLKRVNVSRLRGQCLTYSSYHHTGKYCNVTDFYEIDYLGIQNIDNDWIMQQLEEQKQERQNKPKKQGMKKALVKYGIWSGTRKHPKLEYAIAFALIDDKWAYVNCHDKKSLSGKYVTVLQEYEKAPYGKGQHYRELEKAWRK